MSPLGDQCRLLAENAEQTARLLQAGIDMLETAKAMLALQATGLRDLAEIADLQYAQPRASLQ